VCCSHAPTMLLLTPKPPHHRSPAHDNNSHPNPHPNSNDTTTSPTTHHTSHTTDKKPQPPLQPVPGHNTQPIHPDGPRHAVSPDAAQPTTTTATPTHTPTARTPQLAPQPTTHHGQQPTTATATCPGTQHMAQPTPPLPTMESPHQHPLLATVTTPARPMQGKCQRPPTLMPMPCSPDTPARCYGPAVNDAGVFLCIYKSGY
jgi:hypothetical protein